MTWSSFIVAGLALAACDRWPTVATSEAESSAQCVRDEDCTLVPTTLTCCAECPPAPPFRAAPLWVVDRMYIENENRCLATEIGCPEITCAKVPAGCTARATCAQGRCTAVATGCGVPTS